jgi:hypothetical protein
LTVALHRRSPLIREALKIFGRMNEVLVFGNGPQSAWSLNHPNPNSTNCRFSQSKRMAAAITEATPNPTVTTLSTAVAPPVEVCEAEAELLPLGVSVAPVSLGTVRHGAADDQDNTKRGLKT